jgi:enterochelin esterase-like enzyme
MSEKKTIITRPGELIDFETVFVENPAIDGQPEKTGRVERVEYTTDVYEDGLVHAKYCNVYLPHGYDPSDKEKKYNVLYYQHGNTCDPEIFTGENQKKLDAIFDSGEVEPCIIVSTTYYFDVTKDVEERRRTGGVPAGDGNYEGVKGNFYREVVEDIIPAVEGRYNTYLTDPTPDGIKATRDHRAFSGYSRGSVCTWSMFHNAFEYFRWYAPMSCHTTAGRRIRETLTPEEVVAYLRQPICEHPQLPFFIFASNGGPKDVAAMSEQMKYITKAQGFSYGLDPVKNNIYFSVSEFPHTDLLVPYYYYNSLKVLFKA